MNCPRSGERCTVYPCWYSRNGICECFSGESSINHCEMQYKYINSKDIEAVLDSTSYCFLDGDEVKKHAIKLAISIIKEFCPEGMTSVLDMSEVKDDGNLILDGGPVIGYRWEWSKPLDDALFGEEK